MDIVSAVLLSIFFLSIVLAVLVAGRRSSVGAQKAAVELDDESIRGVAGSLARTQKSVEGRDRTSLAMLNRASEEIRRARKALAAVPEDEDLVPAGRWILDNFYMVEQEIYRVQNMLRSGPPRLPIMRGEGVPRVCSISDNLLSYTNGRVCTETLVMYLNEYQKKTPLTLKELWILPAFLRLSVLKRVAEVAAACSDTHRQWDAAEAFAEAMAETTGNEQEWLNRSKKVPWLKKDNTGGAFLERLSIRLMEQGENAGAQLKWLDQYLSERGYILEDQIASSHHRQGADKMLISNCMDSLRYLDALNWLDLFRTVSVVERTLMDDPAGVYRLMDELSRGMYRRRVERLAERWDISELHLSRLAVQCAAECAGSQNEKERHIGWYLVEDGVNTLAEKVKGRPFTMKRKTKLLLYSVSIWVVSLALAAALVWFTPCSFALRALLFLTAFVAFTKTGVFAVDEVVKRLVRSEVIPAIDLKDGVPEEGRTLVAIPALLPNADRLIKLMEQLETLFIRHGGGNIRYCLLVDHKDEKEPDEERDRSLTELGLRTADDLNRKYAPDTFFFLVRKRAFNEAEGVYMGAERKRGAIMALNRLLLHGDASEFDNLENRPSGMDGIRYVFTLDADTELPHDAAARMIGIMLHPLNRPEVIGGAVRRGYGILQPRVEMAAGSSRQSEFAAAYTGQCGLDHYSGAIADAYQDLFKEGIFTGKGLYDIRVFMECLEGKLPDNRILSHDLLEGSYTRVGFVSDVAVVDGFPSSAYAYFKRMHRWLRGDWQIMNWLGRKTPEGLPNPINRLSKYKIADNIRRALTAPAELAVLFVSAACGRLWLGIAAAVLIEFLPVLYSMLMKIMAKTGGSIAMTVKSSRTDLIRPALNLLFLPFEAWVALDAAARSLYRMAVSKKRLLEWTTAADAEKGKPATAAGYWKYMAAATVLSLLLAVVAVACAGSFAAALWALVALLWAIAPQVAHAISRPPPCLACAMPEEDTRQIRLIARKTWHYFERFVCAEEHWLAPDNFQEYPFKGVASRTSPTNIGLSLVADISACDLGYITPRRMLERMSATMEAYGSLQKWQGHLYNWYDTRTTDPLHPLYVSAVDSGNLMAYLLLGAEAVKECAAGPLVSFGVVAGLADTLRVLSEKKTDAGLEELASALERAAERRDMKAVAELADRAAEAAEKLGGKWACLAIDLIDDMIEDIEDLLETLELLPNEYRVMLEGSWEEYASPAAWRHGGKAREAIDAALKAGGNARLTELAERLSDEFDSRRESGLQLSEKMEKAALEMNLGALYDQTRDLFTIGASLEQGKHGNSYYDLLASEARVTSLLAIAYGRIPARHWRKLGRALALAGGGMPLLSWGGTMFEYLMPALVLRHEPCTLLGETVRSVIQAQQDYAKAKGVPWGISESGYHEFDLNLNYQYRSFGVPDMGMRSGLSKDLVIAPYASLMALPFAPAESMENIHKLVSMGMLGEYGMYEAVDFTPGRRLDRDPYKIVKSYMVHHQGMALAAMTNLLCGNTLIKRFHRIPQVRAVELLMEERAPTQGAVLEKFTGEDAPQRSRRPHEVRMVRTVRGTDGLWPPEVHILSNGAYMMHINAAGAGQSRWDGLALNRWRDDAVTQDHGIFFYIKDTAAAREWSAALQPGLGRAEDYEVQFEPHMAMFKRVDGDVATTMEVVVATDNPAELRRITLVNRSDEEKRLEVTAYFEAVLNTQANDEAHPAFQNLFMQTEYLPDSGVVLVRRRPRDPKQNMPHMACRFVGPDGPVKPVQFDTSREACMGRGRNVRAPLHLVGGRALGSTEGNIPDPAVCMRTTVVLPPMGSISLTFLIACGWDRQKALAVSDVYAAEGVVDRAFEMAWTQEQANMRYLGVKPNQLRFFAAMTSRVLFNLPVVRARLPALETVPRGQSALWELGISGDNPIVVLKISDIEHTEAARHLLLAHAWWRFKGVAVDLVLLNEYGNDYRRPLHERLHDTVMSSHEREHLNRKGGVFLVTAGQVGADTLRTLLAAARCVLKAGQPLTAQLKPIASQAVLAPFERKKPDHWEEVPMQAVETVYHNGIGGFSEDGSEYVIELPEGVVTPMPWCNVLTDGEMGMVTTESGLGYTWMKNSRENKLTPWYNDPVTGRAGEALYLRDRETGDFWSLSCWPVRGRGTYRIRHGQGWTCYEYGGYGLLQQSTVFIPFGSGVRVQMLNIFNPGPKARDIDITWYCDFVLGDGRERTAPFIAVRKDAQTGALWVENSYRDEFRGELLFMAMPGLETTCTASRTEFIGVLGGLENPAGMVRTELSGALGSGLGGCASLRAQLKVPPGMSRQAVLVLGSAQGLDAVRAAVRVMDTVEKAREAYRQTKKRWADDLSVLKVKTPDPAMDLMVNRWLLYQTKASRILGRAGFYQAGGAIGFRDQLQDMLALIWTDPAFIREHILDCAAHQFESGDVQHWWHPPMRGVRTRITDDLVFLPYVTADYVEHTGDSGVLMEEVNYLKDVPISEGQEDWYGVAEPAVLREPLFQHCLQALHRAAQKGPHGLPLIGTGDWNDAMNSVGDEGKGESVWLGWFLSNTQRRFAATLRLIGQNEEADALEKAAEEIEKAVEEHGWDGAWYRRAFFDDGTPLGSAINDECRIDCISQAWAAICGTGDQQRAESALQAVEKHLVSWEDGVLRLLWPPFSNTAMEPGYIKGYLAGVRENGGQYTHAAIWAVWAYARMGMGDMAWRLMYLLNPVQHGNTPMGKDRYKVEPYVTAADVYSMAPLTGRGGWTWYTGSSAWMYRVAVEALLGLRLMGDRLQIEPCIPASWREYNMEYRHKGTLYIIRVENAKGVCGGVRQVILDGRALPDNAIPLTSDGATHYAHVLMGEGES